MKTNFLFLCIALFLLYGCKTADCLPKQTKIGEIEYFDKESFDKIKNPKTNGYYLNREDTVEIMIFEEPDYLYETFGVYKKQYKLIKEYHPNGMIKERGKEYFLRSSKNFKIGKWEYFDEQGNLLRVEDKDGKDREYKMTYKEAFRRVWWYYGFSMKDLYIDVFPTSEGLCWIFEKNGKAKSVNMNTGKVRKINISYEL